MEWQPIETAPKDGTNILVTDADGWVGQVRWWERWYNKECPGWMIANCDEEYGEYIAATHWMPLPEPPQEGDRKMNVNEIRVLQKLVKVDGQYYYTTYNLQVFDGSKWNDVPKVIEAEEPSEALVEKARAGNLMVVPVLTTSHED